jgi:hypothetical protein
MDFDEWFYFLAWAAGEIGFLDRCLVLYRQHGTNAFGAPAASWATRVQKLLNEDFATHTGRAFAAASYADLLDERGRAWAGEDPELAGQLAVAVRFWQAYEQLARRRDGFYAAPSFGARLTRFLRLLASNAYRGRASGGFGRLALARDARELVLPGRGTDGHGSRAGPRS